MTENSDIFQGPWSVDPYRGSQHPTWRPPWLHPCFLCKYDRFSLHNLTSGFLYCFEDRSSVVFCQVESFSCFLLSYVLQIRIFGNRLREVLSNGFRNIFQIIFTFCLTT